MTKSIVPIILGFIATVLLALFLLLMAMADLERDAPQVIADLERGAPQEFSSMALFFSVSGISLLLLIVGLILMIKQRLYKGGVIVLIAGIALLIVMFFLKEIFLMPLLFLFSMPPPILAIISGFLGIKSEEHKGDYRRLITPITGLLFAIFPTFVFIYHHVHNASILDTFPGGLMIVFFVLIPFSIIATVFNIISMFKIRKETNPKAKIIAKILIGLTWSMIAIFVVLLFTWGGPVV